MKVIASNKINYNSNKTTADSLMLIDFDAVFILILAFQGKQNIWINLSVKLLKTTKTNHVI